MARNVTRLAAAACLAVAGVLVGASPARASTQPLTIAASYSPSAVALNGTSTLTLQIGNPNPNVSVASFDFSDVFAAPLLGSSSYVQATGAASDQSECGGVISYGSIHDRVAVSGASIGPLSQCIATFTVIGTTAGQWQDSVSLTAPGGAGTATNATLDVLTPPTSAVGFGTSTADTSRRSVAKGASLWLNATLQNDNPADSLAGVGFTDFLPSGLTIASPNGKTSTCGGGSIAAPPGSRRFAVSGVALLPRGQAGSQCLVSIKVKGVAVGWYADTLGTVRSDNAGSAPGPSASISVIGSGPRVFWSDPATLQFAMLNSNGAGGMVETGSQPVSHPVDISLDPAADRIYWAEGAAASISYASLDGTSGGSWSVAGLLGADAKLFRIAVDSRDSRVYFSYGSRGDPADGVPGWWKLAYVSAGNGDLTPVDLTGPATDPHLEAFALNVASNKIYWVDEPSQSVGVAALNGHNAHELPVPPPAFGSGVTGVDGVGAVAADPAAHRIYWTNEFNHSIGWASLDGGTGGLVNTSGVTITDPTGIALDPTTHTVYWADAGGSIGSAATGGGGGASTINTQGADTRSPRSLSLFKPPVSRTAPTVGGASTVGATLTCSPGTWSADLAAAQLFRAPRSTSYQWFRNGSPISGATATTVVADTAGSYTCAQTATNAVGSTVRSSQAYQVSSS
ncbi:MAG: hypothetical protein JO214_10220 [Frankiaceae bacterium]|nr:hypothetical protein [Frankiaceae bacterium]